MISYFFYHNRRLCLKGKVIINCFWKILRKSCLLDYDRLLRRFIYSLPHLAHISTCVPVEVSKVTWPGGGVLPSLAFSFSFKKKRYLYTPKRNYSWKLFLFKTKIESGWSNPPPPPPSCLFDPRGVGTSKKIRMTFCCLLFLFSWYYFLFCRKFFRQWHALNVTTMQCSKILHWQ